MHKFCSRYPTDVLFDACKHIGLAVNTWKAKYMEIGRHRGMIANVHIKIGSNSYEKVKTFKYLGSLLTNQNSIYDNCELTLLFSPNTFDFSISLNEFNNQNI